MASLHRDPLGRSPYWYTAFTLADGRRTFRSTKERDRKKAWETALAWDKAATLGRSPYWYAAFTLADGRRTFRSTKERDRKKAWVTALAWDKAATLGRRGQLTEAHARKILNDILESAGEGPMNLQSVEEFFNGWVESKQVSKAKGTARRYADVVRPFLGQLDPRKRRGSLGGITPGDVQRFRDAELKAGLANKTANFSLKLL
ncbi:MAG: hypothetical protein ABI016_13950, partial [Chthoniobacterales bacterium]